jgi:predicted ATPase/DNA-binding CsgD family transcriptional regulator
MLELKNEFISFKGVSHRPVNLLSPLTTLIGREKEIYQLNQLLRQPHIRLVTLTGVGGTGKTRLGLAVATQLLNEFRHGVWFVQLASVRDPDLVILNIAQTLGIDATAEQPLLETVKDFLRDKQLLLVLDNFEQVVASAPTVAVLLAGSPDLKVLVTSRELLHLYGEREFRVPALALPDCANLPALDRLLSYPAIALFVERAQAADPNFALTSENAATIAEICGHLDGLPLAIELAAARVRFLSISAIASRLNSRLSLLTGGARDLPVRQQTLRGTLDWSYDLLDETEKCFFRRLGVFVGGWTIEAAQAVAACDAGVDAMVLLESLMDKSLVRRMPEFEDEPRFNLLETVREYATEQLTAHHELQEVSRKHAEYFMCLAEVTEPLVRSHRQLEALRKFETEFANMRQAIGWAVFRQETDIALRIIVGLSHFWRINNRLSDGCHWVETALALPGAEKPTVIRSLALCLLGSIHRNENNKELARKVLVEAYNIAREIKDYRALCYSLRYLTLVELDSENNAVSRQNAEECLHEAIAFGDRWYIAMAYNALGAALQYNQRELEGLGYYAKAIQILQEVGDTWAQASLIHNMANATFELGDIARSEELFRNAIEICRTVGDKFLLGNSLSYYGRLLLRQDRFAEAYQAYVECLELAREIGDRWAIAKANSQLAEIHWCENRVEEAIEALRQGLLILREIGKEHYFFFMPESLAHRIVNYGHLELAAKIIGFSLHMRRTHNESHCLYDEERYEDTYAILRQKLSEKHLNALMEEGSRLKADEVIEAINLSDQDVLDSVACAVATLPETPPVAAIASYPLGLTEREVEVLRLVAMGMTDAQVAEKLVLSSRTVSTHLRSVYSKLGVSNRSAATRFAIENQLV